VCRLCICVKFNQTIYFLEKQNIIKENNIVIWCSEKMNIVGLHFMFVFHVNSPIFMKKDTSYLESGKKISKIWLRVLLNDS